MKLVTAQLIKMGVIPSLFFIFDMKEELIGTEVRGIRMPMFKEGSDVRKVVVDTLISGGYVPKERDVICITESVVARAQGNYVTLDDIAKDVVDLFGEDPCVGVMWPIFSRNRFSLILKGISRASSKVILQLGASGYDGVGNAIYNEYTGVNILEFYKNIIEGEGAQCEIYLDDFSNTLPDKTKNIIVSETHEADKVIQTLSPLYGKTHKFITLADLCNKKVVGRKGWNSDYGLYGSNKAGDELLKLFPRSIDCQELVNQIQEDIKKATGTLVEVMIYGDGAFKDPVSGIWEFADPVVSPGFTKGLDGVPSEVKLKYALDNELKDSQSPEEEIKKMIEEKEKSLVGNMKGQGTTPRHYPDLLGSLADLTSGSGDKGTPVVIVSGYFKNYAS